MRGSLTARVAVTYLLLRLVTGVLVALAARHQVPVPGWTEGPVGYLDMTVLWDGDWYRTIAEQGYPSQLPLGAVGDVQQNAWAFYPLFPLTASVLMWSTGLGFPLVASTLALVCGLGAAIVMARLLRERVGEHAAYGAVIVWAAFPAAVSLQLAYTESMAMLILCGFLWATIRRRWLVAGGLALVLGLTRPIAAPVAVVLAVALLVRWRRRAEEPLRTGELVSGAAGLALCGISGALWPLAAWHGTGSPTAYPDTMAAWRSGGQIVPLKPWVWMSEWLFRDFDAAATLGPVALAVVVTALVVAVCGPWAARLGPELRAWCLAYPAYLAVVLDPFTSIFRYLLPLFPVLVVVLGGGWRDRPDRPRPWRVWVLVALGIAGQVAWIWGLLVFVPPSDYPP